MILRQCRFQVAGILILIWAFDIGSGALIQNLRFRNYKRKESSLKKPGLKPEIYGRYVFFSLYLGSTGFTFFEGFSGSTGFIGSTSGFPEGLFEEVTGSDYDVTV